MKKKILFFLFILLSSLCFSKDLEIYLRENSINSFLSLIDSKKGTGNLNLGLIRIPYKWTVENGRIELLNEKAFFYSDVTIDANGLVSKGGLKGEVRIDYDYQGKQLKIYAEEMNIQGLEDFNLGDFYKLEYFIPLNISNIEPMKFESNGEELEIEVQVINENISIGDGYIKVEGDLFFKKN